MATIADNGLISVLNAHAHNMQEQIMIKYQPLVSVIVPVYAVERYLGRCVASIVNQTYRNLEIILVDDGSPDGCPAICDAWAMKDNRITVIHQSNAGVSAARNRGIEESHGDYLYFMDADDYAEPNLIEVLVARATADDAQIVFCGYETNMQMPDGSSLTVDSTRPYDLTFADNAAFAMRFAGLAAERFAYPSWNKLFRTDFVRGTGAHFPVGVVADEDSYFDFPLYAAAERVSMVPERLYHYMVRSGSAASRYQPALFASRKAVWKHVAPIVSRWNPSFSDTFDNLFLSGIGLCLNFLYEDRSQNGRCRREQVRMIVSDETVYGFVRRVRPVGVRNRLIAMCLRNVAASHCYGWLIAALKRLRR
ncbi:glycosyltransferase [Bifidobacterium sp. 82T10]|uniref:Glycosyltransferase n=1 Tax=Bifidobacterium miconis TaxID=2834435 RepID=A0ABS6WCE5_9BIFI|nr:glycosyltransferase [Bifidobacterium miconis]MBW3091724.1 glycosyltransferase [Bifidobacterium miconis]